MQYRLQPNTVIFNYDFTKY